MRAKKLLTSRQIFRYAVPARTVTKKHWSEHIKNRAGFSWWEAWGPGPMGPLNTDGQKTNVSSVHIHGFHNDSLRLTEIFLHI